MGDFGPSLGELGISTVKKTANVVKQQANATGQAVLSQLTGKSPTSSNGGGGQPHGSPMNIPASQPPSESDPTAGQFDLSSFAKSLKSQVGGGPAGQQKPQQSGTFVMPQASQQPPTETPFAPTFDEKNPFESFSPTQPMGPTPAQINQQKQQEEWKTMESEKQQKIASLRQKLHQENVRKEMEAGEKHQGKDDDSLEARERKDEEEKQRKEAEEERQEQKMAPIEQPGKKSWGFLGMQKVKTSLLAALRPKATRGEVGKNRG